MLRPFVMIPDAEVPDFPVWTEEAKSEFGRRAGYTPDEMSRLIRSPALTMPEIPVAREYLEWFTRAVGDSVPKYGICMESMETWRAQYGNPALGRMLHALLHLGRPTCHWIFIHHMEGGDDEVAGAIRAPADNMRLVNMVD
jgi:hypothetical protein